MLLACLLWILFGRPGVFPPYAIGLLAGVASGAAMLPYTVVKEANPPHLGRHGDGRYQFRQFHFGTGIGRDSIGAGTFPNDISTISLRRRGGSSADPVLPEGDGAGGARPGRGSGGTMYRGTGVYERRLE